ncbi:Benomyl/methotrexate resistance protein [Rhodotorula diobovata]|uniref:Benomyl/methotrexate resistance protein n=1 Tax=Rhodotorula diobovata TaxID=5288 RepID=A0A5C5FLI1_9BASI|nr:Benomyl/methotrexate resistance protein [Rhodotorula diobovata]
MLDLVRESPAGLFLNWASDGRVLPYPEQRPDFVPPANLLPPTRRPQASAGKLLSGESSPDAATLVDGEVVDKALKGEADVDRYPYLVEWAEGDPDNPQNWSFGRKLFVSIEICLLSLVFYIGSSVWTASQPGIQEEFGVSPIVATLGLSLFVLGYGFGPMILSPLQETPRIGRTSVYYASFAAYLLLQAPILASGNLGCILFFRFVTGFVGSPAIATGVASLSDMWGVLDMPYAVGSWSVFAVAGPILGPVIAGFAAQAKTWKWPLYELLWMCSVAFLIFTFLLPETFAATLLLRRAARLRKVTGNPLLKTRTEIEAQFHPGVLQAGVNQVGLAFRLCVEPAIAFCDLYTGVVYACFYLCVFTTFPIVFSEYHGFNLGVAALPFLSFIVAGVPTFAAYVAYYKYRFNPRLVASNYKLPPEANLELAFWGAPAIPLSLFVFGWTGNSPSTSYWGPIIGASLYFPGIFLVFQCVLLYLATSYAKVSASVLGGNALFRATFAAALPLAGRPFFHTLGVGPACSLLGGVSILLMIPLYFLWKKGDRLRARSKFAEHKAESPAVMAV